MNKPDIITSPSGDRMAVVPLADYERLVEAAEDAADVRAYDEFKRKLASGEEELIPSEIANRLIDGENPIRVWREFRGLAVSELAARAGISAPYLSQLETGKRDGTVKLLRQIADALNVQLDDLA